MDVTAMKCNLWGSNSNMTAYIYMYRQEQLFYSNEDTVWGGSVC